VDEAGCGEGASSRCDDCRTVTWVICSNEPMTKGEVLRYAIALALRQSRTRFERRERFALVTQDPNRANTLRGIGGGVVARHDPPPGEADAEM
jgi:hypothetical protein